jgi:hypothetical protein
MDVRWAGCALFLAIVGPAGIGDAEAQGIPRQGSDFVVAGWRGAAYDAPDGAFHHCAMSAPYRSGISLIYYIDREENFSFRLTNDRWRLRTGETYPVSYWIDGMRPRSAVAHALDPQVVTIRIDDPVRIFPLMRRGVMLTVQAAGQQMRFRLDGTSAALERLGSCVRAHRAARTPEATNPFAPTGHASGGFDARTLVADVLAMPSFREYQIVPREDVPAYYRIFSAVWRGDGAVGFLTQTTRVTREQVDELAAEIGIQDRRACEGSYAHGVRDEVLHGQLVAVRVFSSCQRARAGNSTHFAYTYYPAGRDAYFRIAHASTSAAEALNADQRFLDAVRAALRAPGN